jgi:hypothetical protein
MIDWMIKRKSLLASALIVTSLMSVLTVINPNLLAPKQATNPMPVAPTSAPFGPNPGPYGYLYQLWGGNAYFERQTYTTLAPDGSQMTMAEAAPIARPDKGPNVVWLYYRDPVPGNVEGDGIGLAISNDGGVTFQAITGNPVVPKGGCFYKTRAVSPSVVYAPKPDGSGSQFYMVFEGAGTESATPLTGNPCNIPTTLGFGFVANFGNVFLTTSTDGQIWSQPQIIIGVDAGCNNVGTPFIGYFNSKFYVFYHELCPAGVTQTVAQTGVGYSAIMMASGTDPTRLTTHGLAMFLGNSYAWDSRVNTHPSVISEPDNTGQTYYYMVFEGSRNPYGVTGSNWGWGIARTTNIDSGPWQKYVYNPIRQTFNGGLGNDIPHIFRFNAAIRVFQREQGSSNVLIQGSTYPETRGNPGVTVTHPGGDPYLYVFPSRSQCAASGNNDGIGRLDADGISWSVNTHDDTTHNVYMCKGPSVNGLGGQFSVDFNLAIDVNTCPPAILFFQPSCKVSGLDFVDPSFSPSNFNGVMDETTINRDAFVSANTFQAFHNQFFAYTTHDYSWRTFWSGTSYLKQSSVTLRALGGADTIAPTTTMGALPANSLPNFQVSWSGTDTQSGIWQYDVQYQVDGGGWLPWLTATGSTSASFTVVQSQCFHSFSFQARARDNAGNPGSYSSLVSTNVPCNFSLSANPASLAITLGSQQQSTITVTSNGYSGSVTVTASPSSSGVGCSFPGGASSITLSVPSPGSASTVTTCTGSGPFGGYGVLFTGTGGSLSNSINVPVSVSDLGLSLPSFSFLAGSSTNNNLVLTSLQNFAGTVNISFSAPAGLNMSCPSTATIPSGGSATVPCTFSSSTPGDYTVSITGTYTPTNEYYNAPISHTITTTVHVSNFNITSNPSSITLTPGSEQQTTLTVTSVNGFSGTVTLTWSSPGAVTCWFTGGASSISLKIPNGGSNYTIPACTRGGPAGVYSVTFTGTSGSLSRSTVVQVIVQDFTISSTNVQFQIGSSTSSVTLTSLQGFSGTVALSESAQSGVTVSCPASATVPSGGSVTVTCTYVSSTPGAYALGFSGTFTPTNEYYNAPVTHTLNVAVGVVDFAVSLGPATQTVNTGSTASFALTITQIGGFSSTVNMGFNYTVTLAWSAPSGVSCSISTTSASMPPSPKLATVFCTSSTPGKYSLSVTGTSGSLTHTGSAQLLVNQDFQFQDNFNYGQASQMPPIGYNTFGNQSMAGGVLTLSNNGTTGSFASWTKVSSGVNQWTVSENAKWVSGSNSLYGTLDLVANTTSHTYTWAADGFYNQYILYRDGQIMIRANGYAPQLNVTHVLRMDMLSSTLYLFFDGNIIATYKETNGNNALALFGPLAGWDSTDSFSLVKANVIKFYVTFQGYDYDGGQEETLTLNGQLLAQLPPVGSPQNAGVYVTFSLDMTSLITRGTNTLVFTHANWDCGVADNTKNLQVTDATGAVIYSNTNVYPLGCGSGMQLSIIYSFTIGYTLYSFRDDFSYSSISSMTAAGWTVCGTQSQTSVSGGVLSLTNNGVTAGGTCWNNIPGGVTSWTVTDRGQYAQQLGGYPATNGATWLSVTTASHNYQWDLDGYYQSYYLFRDGVKVRNVTGYTPQLGAWHDLTLEMSNGVLTASVDGRLITSCTEASGVNNALKSVTMNPGWETVTNYDFVTINQIDPSQLADFVVGASPIALTTTVGSSTSSSITLSSISGFSGSAALSSQISPSATGLSATLNPTTVSLTSGSTGTSTLTISTTSSTPRGTYIVTVTATSGSTTHQVTLSLTVS